jgi:hypothetical protein
MVIDWSKYCHEIEHLEPHGLRFRPEPSTHPNCTLTGMLGNNAERSVSRPVDSVR